MKKIYPNTYKKCAIAISTYFCEDTTPDRLDVFKHSIDSLVESGFPGQIFVVDDCSTVKDHIEYLISKYGWDVEIIYRTHNGGYPLCKNTGLSMLTKTKSSYMFLADDDIEYQPNWYNAYIYDYQLTGIDIYSFFPNSINYFDKTHIKYINNIKGRNSFALYSVRSTMMIAGCMFFLTPRVVDTIGYFKPLFWGKYGHHDTNYMLRAINANLAPFPCDITDSNEYLRLINPGVAGTSIGGLNPEIYELMEKNRETAFSDMTYQECIV